MHSKVTPLLGQYRPLDSYLHQLDARSKIIPVSLVLILALFSRSLAFYLVLLGLVLGSLLVSRVGVRALCRNLQPVFLLVLITILYHVFFAERAGEELLRVGSWRLTSGAVESAAFFSLRLMVFIMVAFVVTLTSAPSELAEALARLGSPLKRLRAPIDELAMIVFIAIRFIPILYDEFAAIRTAQMIRGVRFDGPLLTRLRRTSAIIIPVFVAALQRADELALAMEARGYRSGRPRTFYTRRRFGPREQVFVGISSAVLLISFVILG